MSKRIPVKVSGRLFESIKAATDHYGVSLQTAARRLRDGWTPEQAFGVTPPRPNLQPRRGVHLQTSAGRFRTLAEASARFGIEPGTIQHRLSSGWTADQAVGYSPAPKRIKAGTEVICNGHTYPTILALAGAFGKKYRLVYKRIRLGWTPEQAVEVEPRPPRFRNEDGEVRDGLWRKTELIADRSVPVGDAGEYKVYVIRNSRNDREYVGITISPLPLRLRGHRAAAKKGVQSKLYNAMRKDGVSTFSIHLVRSDAKNFRELQEQETAEIDKRGTLAAGYNISPGGSVGTPKSLTVGEMAFASYGAAAQYFGIDPTVFNLRIGRLGWTPEQAAEIEPRGKYARRRINVEKTQFPSLKAAAEHFGIPYQLAHERLTTKGWTLEQALEIAVSPDTIKYRGVPVIAFGRMFTSLDECARHFGIKQESLRRRVRVLADPIEAAIVHLQQKPKAGAQAKPVIAFGQTFSSIPKCAKHFGVSEHSLKNRKRNQGDSIERAVQHLRALKVRRGTLKS